jgi:hypothetical protein
MPFYLGNMMYVLVLGKERQHSATGFMKEIEV